MSTISRIFWFLAIWGIAVACQPTRVSRERFNLTEFCYTGGKKNKGEALRNTGYYTTTIGSSWTSGDPSITRYSESSSNSIFYEDGVVIFNFFPDYFQKTKDKPYGFYNRGTQWGSYVISNDTIKALILESPGGMSWEVDEYGFKILNKDTLMRLYHIHRGHDASKRVIHDYTKETDSYISLTHFTPYDSLPNPNLSWIKRRKWFWCDREEYKAWKKSLKSK